MRPLDDREEIRFTPLVTGHSAAASGGGALATFALQCNRSVAQGDIPAALIKNQATEGFSVGIPHVDMSPLSMAGLSSKSSKTYSLLKNGPSRKPNFYELSWFQGRTK